jgi:transposase InsO family protein
MGVVRSATGITQYLTAYQTIDTECTTLAYPATICMDCQAAEVTDDEASVIAPKISQQTLNKKMERIRPVTPTEVEQMREEIFKDKESEPITYEEDEPEEEDLHTYAQDSQEYMHWHYRLNHPSHTVMTRMAKLRMLPRGITRILKTMNKQRVKPPMCNDCCGAKATRKPWRGKGRRYIQRHLKKTPHPGEVVSVDQLEPSIPGFIGQMTGRLTNQRIVASTVFVAYASDLSYVYHQTSMTSEETLKSKLAFEKFAASHGENIKHHHADNGRFKDKLFSKSIEEKGQTISFCGVGAHHQNGIAEKRIGDLQRRATTLLLHAQRRWPDANNTHLWTYAIRAANDSKNYAPTYEDDTCPMSKFCNTASVPKVQNQHHFGCPTYVLRKELQDHKKIRKWSDRTRIGINLGYSSRHAHSVSLILNLQTGLVSPQYHCQYDDSFETTMGTQARSIPTSQWQYKAGFTSEKPDTDEEEEPNEEEWEDQSFEEYYSSHESEETSPPSDSEDEENEVGRPNICHKIRKEVKTTRKIDI